MIRGIHIVQISILDWLTVLAKHAMCAESIYLLYVLDILLPIISYSALQVVNFPTCNTNTMQSTFVT